MAVVCIAKMVRECCKFCIADSVDEPSIIDEPHTKKPRLLERYNTEEAVAKAFGTSNE